MKLIIEIDETDYRQIRAFDEGVTAYQLTLRLYDAVSNGTPQHDAIPTQEGHWISTLATALTTNGIALNGVACSECGKVTYITNRTPICCPWCDTDMRGDDDDNG